MNSPYAVLDDPDHWAAFSIPAPQSHQQGSSNGVWQSQVVVKGMHCGSCALNVERTLRAVPGVSQATVNGATHRAEVVWSANSVKPSQWLEALKAAGYEATPANDQAARHAGQKEVQIGRAHV